MVGSQFVAFRRPLNGAHLATRGEGCGKSQQPKWWVLLFQKLACGGGPLCVGWSSHLKFMCVFVYVLFSPPQKKTKNQVGSFWFPFKTNQTGVLSKKRTPLSMFSFWFPFKTNQTGVLSKKRTPLSMFSFWFGVLSKKRTPLSMLSFWFPFKANQTGVLSKSPCQRCVDALQLRRSRSMTWIGAS